MNEGAPPHSTSPVCFTRSSGPLLMMARDPLPPPLHASFVYRGTRGGAIVMALEILESHLQAPVFGNFLFVGWP